MFLAASGAGILTALVTASLLFWSLRRQMHDRIEGACCSSAARGRSAGARSVAGTAGGYEAEAIRLAALVEARVTFIARMAACSAIRG